ncbi:alpha/beta hydrolase [Bradyrhizobium sp.]|uniref:alpha/beta fold hydrolase n=1 Tax=Bradyrhizobium sp. TaxID=376 RepID=UPI001D86C177|nr:alpha/beta hydrolase [Bradyrhizobium sp.]MBI5322470.1 alpha/beta fold hydrolase [Bradyrhizobium sp.]
MATSAFTQQDNKPSVIALHCSLGSGRQWTRLGEALGDGFEMIAPDLAGYGKHVGRPILPTTLADEVAALGEEIDRAEGPIHLVGHSYGGAVAFKMATSERWAGRIRSLTLIEPVLPTLLRDNAADRRLHDVFADMGTRVHVDLWNGMYMEALDRFLEFWRGSGPQETLPGEARLRMIEVIEKVAFDFTAILGEVNIASAAAGLRVPTLLVSGGLSPYMTQRIVAKLAALIPGAETKHLPGAGHMLPLTHAKAINPDIVRHIELTEDLAKVLMASPPGAARASGASEAQLRLMPG